jgi:hypothetical protein
VRGEKASANSPIEPRSRPDVVGDVRGPSVNGIAVSMFVLVEVMRQP